MTIPIKIKIRIAYMIKFHKMQRRSLPETENSPTDARPEIIGNPINPIIIETQYCTFHKYFKSFQDSSSGSERVTLNQTKLTINVKRYRDNNEHPKHP